MATIKDLNYKTNVFTGTGRAKGAGEALANLVVGSVKLKQAYDTEVKSVNEEQDRILLYEEQAAWEKHKNETDYYDRDAIGQKAMFQEFNDSNNFVYNSDKYNNYRATQRGAIEGTYNKTIAAENKVRVANHYTEAITNTPDMTDDMLEAIITGAKNDGLELNQAKVRKLAFAGMENKIIANPEMYKGMTKADLYEAFPLLKSTMDKNLIPASSSKMIAKIDQKTAEQAKFKSDFKSVTNDGKRIFDISGTEEHRKDISRASLQSIYSIRDQVTRDKKLAEFAFNNPAYAKSELTRLSNNFLRGETTSDSIKQIGSLLELGVPLSKKVKEQYEDIARITHMQGGTINDNPEIAKQEYDQYKKQRDAMSQEEKDIFDKEIAEEVSSEVDSGFFGNLFESRLRAGASFTSSVLSFFGYDDGIEQIKDNMAANKQEIVKNAIMYKTINPNLDTEEAVELSLYDYKKSFGTGSTGTNSISVTKVHDEGEVSKYIGNISGSQKDKLLGEAVLRNQNLADTDGVKVVHHRMNGLIFSTVLSEDGEIMRQTQGLSTEDAKVYIVEEAKRKEKIKEEREKAHWDNVEKLRKDSREPNKENKNLTFNEDKLPKVITAGIDPFDAIRELSGDASIGKIKKTFSSTIDGINKAINQNFKSLEKVSGDLFESITSSGDKTFSEIGDNLTKWFNGELSEINGMSEDAKGFVEARFSGVKEQLGNLKKAYNEFELPEFNISTEEVKELPSGEYGGTDDEENIFQKTFDFLAGSLDERAVGSSDTNSYKGMFLKSIANSILPDIISKKEYGNEDFSNKFLGKLDKVANTVGSKLKVGESMLVNPDTASKVFGFKGYGYGKGNIQRDTGDKEVDLMRKGLGNFTLRRTEDGFEVYDVYDFKKGTHKLLKGRSKLFVTMHKLGEDFLAEGSEDAIKINIKLPRRG